MTSSAPAQCNLAVSPNLFITILVTLIALASPAQLIAGGPTLFLPAVTYDSGGIFPTSLAVADLNGDGKPDLIVANLCSPNTSCASPPPNGTVGVLLGNGDGTFKPAVSYNLGGATSGLQSVVVADVNDDGKPDLLVAIRSANFGEGGAGVLLGNGDGTFQGPATYDSGGQGAWSIAVLDVNADNKADLVLANADSNTVSVLLGKGDGTFHPPQIYDSGGYSPRSVALADMNDDGKPDILVANLCLTSGECSGEGALGVLHANGDGTFQPAAVYDPGGDNSVTVVVADVNEDGKLDAVVLNVCTLGGSGFCASIGTVGILLGNGDAKFQPVVTYATGGGGVGSVAVGDVNGDGKPDLVAVGCCGSNAVSVLVGNGDGTFQPSVPFDSGGAPESIVIADLNRDGKPDLIASNFSSNTVGVLLNNTPFDTTPPVITISATPKLLLPPNGKMVPVAVTGTITDSGSGINKNSAAYAVKDEYGEAQPKDGISLDSEGHYSFTIFLQASRRGSDRNGRRYTVTVRAKDNAGNAASKSAAVIVPHDPGHRGP